MTCGTSQLAFDHRPLDITHAALTSQRGWSKSIKCKDVCIGTAEGRRCSREQNRERDGLGLFVGLGRLSVVVVRIVVVGRLALATRTRILLVLLLSLLVFILITLLVAFVLVALLLVVFLAVVKAGVMRACV